MIELCLQNIQHKVIITTIGIKVFFLGFLKNFLFSILALFKCFVFFGSFLDILYLFLPILGHQIFQYLFLLQFSVFFLLIFDFFIILPLNLSAFSLNFFRYVFQNGEKVLYSKVAIVFYAAHKLNMEVKLHFKFSEVNQPPLVFFLACS